MENVKSEQVFLTLDEAAKVLRINTATLRKWNKESRDPAFSRIGRKIIYSQRAITRFFNENIQREAAR